MNKLTSFVSKLGAGAGGATSAILEALGEAYLSYTYTDISSDVLAEASSTFRAQGHSLIFKTLDIEKEPEEQGFDPQSYEVRLQTRNPR